MATDMTVTTETLRQLGGRRFIAMTGAKDFIARNDSTLSFRLPDKPHFVKDRINYVEIELTPVDTYTLRFSRVTRKTGELPDIKSIATRENVYNDNLREVFTSVTGLATSL